MHTFLILFQGSLGGLAQLLPIVPDHRRFLLPINKASAEAAAAITGDDSQPEDWRSRGYHRRSYRRDNDRTGYQLSYSQRRQVDPGDRSIGDGRHRRGTKTARLDQRLDSFAMKKKNLLTRVIIIAVVTLVGLYLVIGPRRRPTLKDFTWSGIKASLESQHSSRSRPSGRLAPGDAREN